MWRSCSMPTPSMPIKTNRFAGAVPIPATLLSPLGGEYSTAGFPDFEAPPAARKAGEGTRGPAGGRQGGGEDARPRRRQARRGRGRGDERGGGDERQPAPRPRGG